MTHTPLHAHMFTQKTQTHTYTQTHKTHSSITSLVQKDTHTHPHTTPLQPHDYIYAHESQGRPSIADDLHR